ncbi:MAG: acyl-CoA dehydrogenase family protein [Gammaproteobacteria bacterium]
MPSAEALAPVAAARHIAGLLAATTADSEAARRVAPAAVELLREAGLSRLLKPRARGGAELPLRAQIQSCIETARGDAAASWLMMVCGAHDFVLGGFSDACLDEVFASGPDTLIAGTLAPQGKVTRAPGGWRLEGRWQFCSGVDHSPWLMFGALQADAAEDAEPWGAVHLMVPKAEVEVIDTWHVLGMRGTGSKDVAAHGVFVPLHRSVATPALFTGTSPHARGALYHLPVLPSLACMGAGSVYGMAERAYDDYVARTRVRGDVLIGGGKAHHTGLQRRVAEARLELDSARRLLDAICDRWDELQALDNPPVAPALRVRIRLDAAYVVELCRRAVDRMFAVSGAHAVYDDSGLQRAHRDIHTASHHAIFDFDMSTEFVGRTILGVDLGPEHAIS